jgi:hypothetical protein
MSGKQNDRFTQASERRRGRDRRGGRIDGLFKALVARGVVVDQRRSGRRRKKKDPTEELTEAHAYLFYAGQIRTINLEREKSGLAPVPVPTFEEWIERRSRKPARKSDAR